MLVARVEIVEGHAMSDYIHLLLMISLKYSIAHIVGFLKGKFRDYLRVKRNFTGRHFWGIGYCVSTVELEEKLI